jgi:hypothetical protein
MAWIRDSKSVEKIPYKIPMEAGISAFIHGEAPDLLFGTGYYSTSGFSLY